MLFGKGNIVAPAGWSFLPASKNCQHVPAFILSDVVDSQHSLLSYDGLDASRALAFSTKATLTESKDLFLWIRAHQHDDLVVLDVTASEAVADQYLDFTSYGFHVILTAACPLPNWCAILANRG